MSLTATSRSVAGTLWQEVVVDGRHRISTDEPVDLGGDGSAPSPQELFPEGVRSAVLEATNVCSRGETVVVTVTVPMTLPEVEAAYDEIDEKHHLQGIHLHFDEDDGTPKAVFEPIER